MPRRAGIASSVTSRSSRCRRSSAWLPRAAGIAWSATVLLSSAAPVGLAAQTLEGHLLDGTTHEPIPAGVVSLLSEDGEVLDRVEADSAGYFRIDAPGAGSYYLRAERIGYRTTTDGIFDLERGGRLEVEFYIVQQPVELEGVEARVERTNWYETRRKRMLEAQGFYDRQTRTSGYFITPEEIEERPPMRPRDLLRMIPGVHTGNVTGRPGSDGLVTLKCAALAPSTEESRFSNSGFAAYIDGVRVFQGATWDMGRDLQMVDIAAVEVYPRIATLPIEYATLGVCGAILIWTG